LDSDAAAHVRRSSMLSHCERLIHGVVKSGETPFVVYGGNGADVRLIDLTEELDREALAQDRAVGMKYCGVVGLVDGRPRLAIGPDAGAAEIEAMCSAGLSLARQVFGDSVMWLEALWSLPDERMEVMC